MNRSIKFRVWYLKEKRWIETPDGLFFKYPHNSMGEYIGDFINSTNYVTQQFTGLHDKNNREIYEGDIVKFKWRAYEHDIEESIGEVYFEDGIFFFGRDHEFAMNDCNFLKKTLEVVGNIFENPELISK